MMGTARLVLVSALLASGVVVMASESGRGAVPAVSAATPAPADPCAGAAWPYRPAGCLGAKRPAVRVIGASRTAEG
jgi:hypothetical protein